jgi:hypothetical protein
MAESTPGSIPEHIDPNRRDDTTEDESGGQVSEGPSGFGGPETSGGGADAVPDTPDVNPGTSAPIRDSRD